MKQNFCLLVLLVALIANKAVSQVTTIVNYDFNSVSSYPVQPTATASNITCSGASSEAFQTYTGAATGSSAFAQNSTSGNALAMVNSGGTNTRYFLFQLGGSDLNSYSGYSLYLQPQRSFTGATTITVAYSTSGSSYTNLPTTYTVGTSFSETLIDLSSITALNYASAVYIKLMVSGASQTTGTIRIDNFEVQATKGFANGNPWQINGYDVSFSGKLGIGMSNPAFPLEVTGNSSFHGNQTIGGNQDVTGSVIARQGVLFDNTNGIRYIAPTTSSKARYILGSTGTQRKSTCLNSDQTPSFQMDGGYISNIPLGSGSGSVNSSLTMMSAPWDGNGILEVEGVDASGNANNVLMVNYFCGRNTLINVNNGLPNRGGKVIMGEKVSMARYVGIGYAEANGNVSETTALNIFANEDNQTAIKLNSWNGTVKAIDLVNTDGTENFTVWQNGTMKNSGSITSKSLEGNGFRTVVVDGTGKLYAGGSSSTTATSWNLGGNDVSTTSPNYIGTTSSNPFDLWAGGAPQISIKPNGKTIVGSSLLTATDKFSVTDITSVGITVFADGLTGGNSNKSHLILANKSGHVKLAQDEYGIGRLTWTNSDVMSFKGESILIGVPDSTDSSYGEIDINTKLMISCKTSNDPGNPNGGYTERPLKIINLNSANSNKSIFEISQSGHIELAVGDPSELNAFDILDRSSGAQKYLFRVKKDGRVFSREINVLPSNINFPDYVFANDYKLQSLDVVEKYINENKHLPSIPSAKEVAENGIDVADMFAKQMEKIENLYLYVIELKKENDLLKKEVESLKNK